MITVALLILVAGGACFLWRAVRGPSLADRIVALDGLIVTILAAILCYSIRVDTDKFLDVAVVVGFVGFVGTTAGARFIEQRGA